MADEPDDLTMVTGAQGDPMFTTCFEMMDAMRQSVLPIIADRFVDPREALTVLMTAASMLGGMQAGALLAIGAFKPQHKRRVVDAASHNFRQGMDAGLRHGLTAAADDFGGHA